MRFKFFITTLTSFLLFLSIPGKAQKQDDENTDILEYLSISNSFLDNNSPSSNLDLVRRKSNAPEFGPIDEIWDKTPWLNPEINFRPSSSFISIGDINGDGVDDLAKRFLLVADERDPDISIMVNKTMIFYGGSDLSADYDELIYVYIYPLGDINGDGYSDAIGRGINDQISFLKGSASGLTEVSTSISDTLFNYSQNSYRFIVGRDLNKDGIEDIYGFYRDSQTFQYKYFQLNGSSSFNDLNIKEVAFPDNIRLFTNYWFRFSKNDNTLLGVIEAASQGSTNMLKIFRVSENYSMTIADSISLEFSGFTVPLISDFDGDNVDDFIYLTSNENNNNFFYKGTNNIESFFESPIRFTNDVLSSFGNTPFVGGPVVLGDVIGDNRTDILASEDDAVKIINFNREQGRLVLTESIHSSNFLFNSEILQRRESIYKQKNSHYQGFNTFSLPIESEGKFGNIIFKTKNDSDLFEWETLLENKIDYNRKVRNEVFHLHDLEDDGIDNFAVAEYTANYSSIVIYNGFNDSSPKSIELSDEMFVGHIESGFFNNESERSLAVLLRPFSDTEQESEFRLYNQENLNTPVFTFFQTDLEPSLDKLSLFSNLGDINNDGFDDLGFSAGATNHPEKTFIFLGNASLTKSPSIIIDLDRDFPNPVQGNTSLGATTIQGIGDINNDNIDDFILGDGLRYINNELFQKNSQISGVIYVLFGQDVSVPTFNGPDLELHPDTSNSSNQQWLFGGMNSVATGDFDGDGTKDIVGISFRHSNSEFTEGAGALTYFFGKDGFTSQPDTTIPIRTDYIYNPNQQIQETYSKFTGRAILKSIPDINGDNADELLFVGNRDNRNAILFEISNSATEIASALYAAPNKNLGLSPAGNFLDKQYLPLVGDYNGDGKLNFLGYQPTDGNFRDTPIYLFELDNIPVSIEQELEDSPSSFSLNQNYPNPFNPSTNISFTIPEATNVEISVYNMLGQKVSTLVNARYLEGKHTVSFNASNLASGIYLYRIKSNDFVSTKRMTLIK